MYKVIMFKSLVVIFLFLNFNLEAQEYNEDVFVISKLGNRFSEEKINQCLEKVDFTYYRLNDQQRVLEFTDGSEIILLSNHELKIEDRKERYSDKLIYPTKFTISESNILVELFENTEKIKRPDTK